MVLAVVAVVGEVAEPTLERGSGARLLIVVVGACVAVLVLFPRFYRRNLVEPIDRLVAAMERLRRGERNVELAIRSNDELGYVGESLNRLSRALADAENDLAAKLAEVRALNEELRQQVAARSRELAEVLAHALPAALAVGDVVNQRYRVAGLLGRGGMGTVYAVERIHDGRRLALKVMQTTTRESIARFAREAQIAAALDHENLVAIVDVGTDRGLVYMTMELVAGGNLENWRDRFGDCVWAREVLRQLATALEVLHARGVVHRDLKPANVLMAGDGERILVKVTDFGIALQETDPFARTMVVRAAHWERLTATGAMLGTLPYMAPELADGAHYVSPAADIFSFGLIAHELLAGRPAFEVPPVLIARGGLPMPRALPSTIAATLAAVIASCLEMEPARRPAARVLAAAFAV
jgi:HAMP domain-containing protein